jgi:hypothetical protein
LGVLTVPTQFALGTAGSAFEEGGQLKDEAQRNLVKDVLVELVTVTSAIRVAR